MSTNDPKFDALKQKYASVLHTIEQQGVRLAHLHVQDGKLVIQGTAPSEDVKNAVWNQIKLVDSTYSDLSVDIQADPNAPAKSASASGQSGQTYTVKSGDSLSKIAKQFYGDANAYMDIFNANKNILSDPDQIQPGQQLTIPSRAS